MRTAILFGLVFIGDFIGRGLGAEIDTAQSAAVTNIFAVLLLVSLAMDTYELLTRERR